MTNVQLPDYLPSRYKNWFEFYLDVVRMFHKTQEPLNENSEVSVAGTPAYMGLLNNDPDEVYYSQKFPVVLIKARALDYVLSKLPELSTTHQICQSMVSTGPIDPAVKEQVNDLLHLSRTIQKHK